ncbi:hypothetical protein HO173_006484 [Letharia columbiana]|uniref:Aminoglycoside phosphotransferase domain-containing protein n=1 Tax=Letharia columbiana TaxID=112416 RepID=A0A8H6L4H1_9LECA|nr:uncharacterized protein HO173_006484 [Letharia columbiana]KAF6235290.1 hypothetical protein HO173_006484 [Letharia columbiana]
MELSIALPFIAADVPSALPTNAEIEASKDVIAVTGGRRVVRVGTHFVVKYGLGVTILEGENMLFVRSTTTIPIPKVYALYTETDTKKNYIVMENIEGHTLAYKWPSLTESQKKAIATKLKLCFDELRQLPSPGYFGSLGKRPLLDDIFWTSQKKSSINGPFENEDAVNEAMAQKYTFEVYGRTNYVADFYRQALPHVLCGHAPTLTHADFQRKNIIVQVVPPKVGLWNDCQHQPNGIRDAPPRDGLWTAKRPVEEEFKVTIIDWEKAGWYPSYWEYGTALYAVGRWDDDWGLFLRDMLSPYYSEARWLQTLRFELWS